MNRYYKVDSETIKKNWFVPLPTKKTTAKKPEPKYKFIRNCEYCGKEFATNREKQIFCSTRCRNTRNWVRGSANSKSECCLPLPTKKTTAKKPEQCAGIEHSHTHGLKLKKEQRPTNFICANCGKKFTNTTYKAILPRYCSYKCKQAAHYQRRKERAAAESVRTLEKKYLRECPNCGQEFSTGYEYQKFCSSKCRISYHSNHHHHDSEIQISDEALEQMKQLKEFNARYIRKYLQDFFKAGLEYVSR